MISSRRWTGSSPVRARISAIDDGEVAVRDLAGREVDRDVEGPLRRAAARATRAPAGRRAPAPSGRSARSGRFPRRSRRTRRVEQAALGVPPAHQRLQPGDLAAARARRPAGSEGPARRARARGAARARPPAGAARRARISASNSSQRARPRSFARYMAASASRISRSALTGSRSDGRATAIPMLARDEVLDPAHRVGLGEGGGDPVGDRDRLLLVGEPVDQDAELVAAEAGDDVAGAQMGAQARGDRAQQLVAGVVAHAVVDQLEVVEVEEEDPDRRARDGGARCSASLERVDEAEPVGQAGERSRAGPGGAAPGRRRGARSRRPARWPTPARSGRPGA